MGVAAVMLGLRQEGAAAGSVVDRIDSNDEKLYVTLTKDHIKKEFAEFDESTYRDQAYPELGRRLLHAPDAPIGASVCWSPDLGAIGLRDARS